VAAGFSTVDDVAELLGRHPHTIYRLAREGELAHYRVGRNVLFRPADVDAYIEARRVEARAT
jgi:excisionase family DNA binding protein